MKEVYSFKAHIEKSSFNDQPVLIIHHNLTNNPMWVRRYHDEMVQISSHIYLATSHYKIGNKLKFVSYLLLIDLFHKLKNV
jgi:hypothetical protein